MRAMPVYFNVKYVAHRVSMNRHKRGAKKAPWYITLVVVKSMSSEEKAD